jgi:hypothetical protein
MDDLTTQHGMEARKDWSAYCTIAPETPPRYHNRPDCEDGSKIEEKDIRAGTDGRPLCEKCRSAEKPKS